MGICHEAEPTVDGGLPGLDAARLREFLPEDQADRTVHLFREQDVAKTNEGEIDKPVFSVDPREQILALYDEYRPRLLRYIHSMRLKRDQAEEVIQETFMRLTTELLQETDIGNVQGWIVRVAHNLAVDVLKKNDRAVAVTAEITSFVIESAVDPSSGPEEMYLNKEQMRRMEIALSTFNPQQQQCFHMRVQGFRYKDIGLALGISEQRAAYVMKQVAVRLAAVCG